MGASQFLNVHQERAVAVNVNHLAVRKSNLCSDCGWKTEPHGSESRRREELSSMAKVVILACPHLVLSDTGRDDGLTLSHFIQKFDHILRLDQVFGIFE